MKAADDTGVTFVNVVLGRGMLNNVVNLQFGVFQFSENEETGKIEPDIVINCRLRMDRMCAQQLYTQLGELFEQIEKATQGGGLIAENDISVSKDKEPKGKPN